MPVAVEPQRLTISRMAKKKASGKHNAKRINVGFPEPWHAVARRLAAKGKQPVLYLLIAMLEREAKEQGIADLPAPPWDEEGKPEGG